MRNFWRLLLCGWGLILFVALTCHAARFNREMHPGHSSRYFWWGGIRLDSDPLNRHPKDRVASQPCPQDEADCIEWDPEYIWVDPGWMEKALVLSALPAFLVCSAIVRGLARQGVGEVTTFMVTMPVGIMLWFYSLGWWIDRLRRERRARAGRG